ncbi:MAG: hypothetical protein F4Y63_09465 [Chloroflexi bacterium]|nr:hypothetical protein [Chloroflexota bacterium]MYK60887.1 hypothetical protein [Chloroflexota bacterium]
MLRRLGKVIASITATAGIVIALLVVIAAVGQRHSSQLARSGANADIYVMSGYTGSPITCHRDNNGITIETDNGQLRAVMVGREGLEQCIEGYKSGRIPFDPRNYIGRYEAGYVIWEGVDHENIYHWGVPDECAPHYQFKQKSHPWLIDALGLVETIEVTFAWTGTDAEWGTCSVAREKQIAEIDLSEFEIATTDNAPN